MSDSKVAAIRMREEIPKYEITLGPASSYAYVTDPRHLLFTLSRYKFVAKMLSGLEHVCEVGCFDGLGAPLVAQEVKHLLCTDIDLEVLAGNGSRMRNFGNIQFAYADFRKPPMIRDFDALYHIDVLEHIFPEEEAAFMRNTVAILKPGGVMLIGTPNQDAARHASKFSNEGHVNLKTHDSLKELCLRYFDNVFMFSMNDEMVHTGFSPLAHYLWALCASQRERT